MSFLERLLARIRPAWERFSLQARLAAGRFMMGRNGLDALNVALLCAYLALYFLRGFLGLFIRSLLLYRILSVLGTVSAVLFLFRLLSRNLPSRQAENRKWLSVWRRVKRLGAGTVERTKDRDHRYFTCKRCGAVCRVPAGKGRIIITCPRCGEKIQAKS